jgi:hypothetical protein
MKKALIVLAAVAACASTFAQSSSSVIFRNRNIATTDPNPTLPNGATNPNYVPGGNQNGSYNVPLYASNGDNIQNGVSVGNGNSTIGAGTLPGGGVTVGLFYQNNLLGTAILGTTATASPFFVTPSTQELQIKDAAGNVAPAGSTPVLTVRAWSTAHGSFAAAQTTVGAQWGEWVVTAKPLGGVPPTGGTPITPPSLTGWGNENGSGFELNQVAPEPSTIALAVLGVGALALARRRK